MVGGRYTHIHTAHLRDDIVCRRGSGRQARAQARGGQGPRNGGIYSGWGGGKSGERKGMGRRRKGRLHLYVHDSWKWVSRHTLYT